MSMAITTLSHHRSWFFKNICFTLFHLCFSLGLSKVLANGTHVDTVLLTRVETSRSTNTFFIYFFFRFVTENFLDTITESLLLNINPIVWNKLILKVPCFFCYAFNSGMLITYIDSLCPSQGIHGTGVYDRRLSLN